MARLEETDRDQYAEVLLGDPEGDPAEREPEEVRTRWLARVIVSESDDDLERYLVGWVIRNRTETGYYTDGTYEGTALKPYQYSAFNPGNDKRDDYIGLPDTLPETPYVTPSQWESALSTAEQVMSEGPEQNPFRGETPFEGHVTEVGGELVGDRIPPERVRHFFAPVSMVKTPKNSYAEWMGETVVVPAWFDRSKHVPMGTTQTFFFADVR